VEGLSQIRLENRTLGYCNNYQLYPLTKVTPILIN